MSKDKYLVRDTPFNRAWYWWLIGKETYNPPLYAQVTRVRPKFKPIQFTGTDKSGCIITTPEDLK